MQFITIAGNITKDAVARRTQNGDAVTGFSVAVNGINRDAPSTFYDCSLWGKRGEALAPHLKKGGKVTVCGSFGTREHEGKTYLTVNVQEVTLQGGKPNGGESNVPASRSKQQPHDEEQSAFDDEIPF